MRMRRGEMPDMTPSDVEKPSLLLQQESLVVEEKRNNEKNKINESELSNKELRTNA